MRTQADKLHGALTKLKYEGRMFNARNLKSAREAVDGLGSILKRHCCLHEEVLFPFLKTHIPRKEAPIHFLEAEHGDIQKNSSRLKKDLKKNELDPVLSGKIYERGIYLISLFQHHLSFEHKNIVEPFRSELRRDEIESIRRRIDNWTKKHSGE